MDRLELRTRRHVVSDDESYDVVDIFLNGRDMLDLLRGVELPFARAEGHEEIAGSYLGLPPEVMYLPSRHLLGEANRHYSYDDGRISILECECMCSGCWPLLVRVHLDETRVAWTDFEQPHRSPESISVRGPRPWSYRGFGPFVFDRGQYERALVRQPER